MKTTFYLLNVLLASIVCIVFSSNVLLASPQVLRFLKPEKKDLKPAIVLTAFGTSTKAQKTFDFMDKEIRGAFPGYEIRWAFTSQIIRNKMNAIYKKKGINKRLHSLPEVLASLKAAGHRKAVVQSLHVFPGAEYMHMLNQARMDGMNISIGEPLVSQWEEVHELLKRISKDFLKKEEGCNVFAGHGSPNTYSAPSTAVYLAFDRLLSVHYPNCFLGSVEGVPDRKDALDRAKKYRGDKVRIIPFMLVAGDHIMNDIMGEEPDEEGDISWALELKKAGKKVSCPEITVKGERLYKGLGFYHITNEIIVKHIKQALADL